MSNTNPGHEHVWRCDYCEAVAPHFNARNLPQPYYDLLDAAVAEASQAALDVERLARALHYSTWACPTGQTVIDWCDPHRGEMFHVSQAAIIAAEYARLAIPAPEQENERD